MKKYLLNFLLSLLSALSLVTFFGCATKHPAVQAKTMAIRENSENSLNITFSPNPVKENLTVSFNYQSSGGGQIKIYDFLGEQIQQKRIEVKQGPNSIVVPVDDLDEGVYIIEAYAGSRQLGIRRITKE